MLKSVKKMSKRYWVLQGREQVTKIVRMCVLCTKLEGLPFKTIFSPNLPNFKVDENPPFTQVGVDYACPLLVYNKDTKEQDKFYVCLFTCASTRAVHLKLTDNLSFEALIRAFRRFCARRGLPRTLVSDNAFRSASKEIKKLLRTPRLKEYLALKI